MKTAIDLFSGTGTAMILGGITGSTTAAGAAIIGVAIGATIRDKQYTGKYFPEGDS